MSMIFDLAYAARRGDMDGVNAALSLMVADNRSAATIINARARADRESGRTAPLPPLSGSMMAEVLREQEAPRRLTSRPAPPPSRRSKASTKKEARHV